MKSSTTQNSMIYHTEEPWYFLENIHEPWTEMALLSVVPAKSSYGRDLTVATFEVQNKVVKT